ncbi:MAG: S9 family peptidase [Puniceicoccaceae bacterium]|nr:MAG: S9 family peptidase [Puniceicoccaceae bacterium]
MTLPSLPPRFCSLLTTLLLGVFAVTPTHAGTVESTRHGSLVLEGIPEIPEAVRELLRPYRNTRAAGFQAWDEHNQGIYISTRFGETVQFHHVAFPGAARRQVTFFPEPVRSLNVNPDPARPGFLFVRDQGGDEFFQVFHHDLANGRTTLMTDGSARHQGPVWSPDGGRFAYTGTGRNGRDFDIYVRELEGSLPREPVFAGGGLWWIREWSPDGDRLLINRYVSVTESMAYVLDVATGEARPVLESVEPVSVGAAAFAPDGRSVLVAADFGGEFRRLHRVNLANGETIPLTADLDWDVAAVEVSPKTGDIAFTTNRGGFSEIFLIDGRSGERRSLPGIPAGVIGGLGFDREGRRLAFTINRPVGPGDVFIANLDGGEVDQWTFSEIGGLDPAGFVEPELIHYPTFDQDESGGTRQIPSLYFRPLDANGPRPVLISIHGGPESQARPTFSSRFQFLVRELGMAVLEPNVRGSTGYGRTYVDLDNGYLREDAVRDIGALLDWIATRPELDADRVVVLGGSYGGYMTLASLIHYGDRLRAGVSVVGITHFVTFLENTQAYRRDARRVEYGDERDPAMRAFLHSISPLTHADRIRSPVFIAQGLNDPRVPASEAEQMVAAIRKNGPEVWYLLAEDEGHGFSRRSNADFFEEAMLLFLDRSLELGVFRDS